MAKGNKGPRLVPEIAALVNVQWFVLSVCLASAPWEADGFVAFFFFLNVCVRTGFGRSRVHSWSVLQGRWDLVNW